MWDRGPVQALAEQRKTDHSVTCRALHPHMVGGLWGNLPFQRIYTGEKEWFWSGGLDMTPRSMEFLYVESLWSLYNSSGPLYFKATVPSFLWLL